MNGNINVNINPSAVLNCGRDLKDIGTELSRKIERISSIVEGLKDAWTSTSAEKYASDILTFKTTFKDFSKVINEVGDIYTSAGYKYNSLNSNLYK